MKRYAARAVLPIIAGLILGILFLSPSGTEAASSAITKNTKSNTYILSIKPRVYTADTLALADLFYPHSITDNTVFHKVKIPMAKGYSYISAGEIYQFLSKHLCGNSENIVLSGQGAEVFIAHLGTEGIEINECNAHHSEEKKFAMTLDSGERLSSIEAHVKNAVSVLKRPVHAEDGWLYVFEKKYAGSVKIFKGTEFIMIKNGPKVNLQIKAVLLETLIPGSTVKIKVISSENIIRKTIKAEETVFL